MRQGVLNKALCNSPLLDDRGVEALWTIYHNSGPVAHRMIIKHVLEHLTSVSGDRDERGHPHFLGTGEWVAPSNPLWERPTPSPASQPRRAFQSAPTRCVCTAAAVASLRARFSHSCGINVSVASLGRCARTCERYHGLFSPGSRPTASSQTLSASPTGLRARWACGLMVLGAAKC